MTINEKQLKALLTGILLHMLLFWVFVILKLCECVTWSWWWITSPLWMPIALPVAVVLVVGVVIFVGLLLLKPHE